MIRPSVLAILLIVTPPSVLAQDEDSSPAQQEPDSQESPEKPAETKTDPSAAAEKPDDSPFDYQASEKISEDLSVSFPVDI